MMGELAIRFRAFDGCPHIVQMPAHGKTVLKMPHVHPHQGRVLAVMHRGVSLRFRTVAPDSIEVNLIPLEGGNVEILCAVPKEPLKGLHGIHATPPAPVPQYGLERPIDRKPGGSQWLTQ